MNIEILGHDKKNTYRSRTGMHGAKTGFSFILPKILWDRQAQEQRNADNKLIP